MRGVGSLMVTVERAEGLSKEWMDSLERFWHPQISFILKMTMTTFQSKFNLSESKSIDIHLRCGRDPYSVVEV